MSDAKQIQIDNTTYNLIDSGVRNPVFTEATSRVNIASGESIFTTFGKIKKFFTDLKTVAFSGSYADLSDKPTSLPASDVYAWAKSATKPTYTKSDIGLGNVPNVTTNNQTPTFSQASTRANIASGETLSTIFGKLMKWYADLKTVAFSGSYADLSNKPTIPTIKLLWTNSDPTATMAAQNITLSENITNFDLYFVEYNVQTTIAGRFSTGFIRVDTPAVIQAFTFGDTSTSGRNLQCFRTVSPRGSSYPKQFSIGAGHYYSTMNGTAVQNNILCVPCRIYGVKGVI